MNAKEFLDKEKTTYGNLYSELIFVLDDIEEMCIRDSFYIL